MLRHILMINRLMYHHHLLSRGEDETIYKIYTKQKEDPLQGDWFSLLLKDFEFIGVELDEREISSTQQSEYKTRIKNLVKKAAFDYMSKEKRGLSKIKDIRYDSLKIQDYLISPDFNPKERNLLYALRSRSHPAKLNYRKMNSSNLLCSLGCQEDEDQTHIFEKCRFLKTDGGPIRLDYIYEDIFRQKEAIQNIFKIETERLKLKQAVETQPVL